MAAVTDVGVVWDNHSCMPLRPDDEGFLPQLERVRAAGVNAVTLNIAYGAQSAFAAARMAKAFGRWVAARPEGYLLAKSASDVETAKASGRLAICFDIEGMDALEGDIANIERFYDLGVRWMLVAYNRPNLAGGGCLVEDERGLTPFGRRAVAEMNRVGMACCGTHCSYRTAREMIDASADPVIFSHSNPRALWDHPRNIPDDLIRACAARGGVIGINGFGPFLGPNGASIETYARHIEYVADLVGDEFVGIGLDYVFDRQELDAAIAADPLTFPPEHYASGARMLEPWCLPDIARVLLHRGFSQGSVSKMLGGNHLRVARQVWKGSDGD